jgi:hypothetical protein
MIVFFAQKSPNTPENLTDVNGTKNTKKISPQSAQVYQKQIIQNFEQRHISASFWLPLKLMQTFYPYQG